ncbi:MAG TPA: nuclear transport factor 2 family protein, partial [Myxococcota bacterium]|nr:nuclear transport factor 2 family protein [Myxococcota bacterium]
RVPANAATASCERMADAARARDLDAFLAVLAEDARVVHHPTGSEYPERDALPVYEDLVRLPGLRSANLPLASLGDSLALCRGILSFDAHEDGSRSFGPADLSSVFLAEVDARGQRVRTEFFAPERLADALARLYERYAELLPDGPERTRAAATARSVAALLGPPDPDRYAGALAPDVEYLDDRRVVGMGSAHGAPTFLRGYRTLLETARGFATRTDDVLAARPDALLVHGVNFGADRVGGGAYETHLLQLWRFGADGRLALLRESDPDREEEALARFDELAALARGAERSTAASPAGVARIQNEAARAWIESLRAGPGASQCEVETVATRGERLALLRVRDGAAGAERLSLVEGDGDGRRGAESCFEPGELERAREELDRRFAAGEAAPFARVRAEMRAFERAFDERDWDALAARCTPDLVVHDHRLLGWETLHGPAAYVQALRFLVELAPDVRLRLDHVALCARGYLVLTVWAGSREGGVFEAPILMVAELDGKARIARFDQYDLAQLEAARARHAQLAAPPAPLRVETAATRQLGRERSEGRAEVIATRGQRLALVRRRRPGARGAGERESLCIVEAGEGSEPVEHAEFPPGELDAAYAALDERYASSEAASVGNGVRSFEEAIATRDWDAVAARFAPELVVYDHRPLGWEPVRGNVAYAQALRGMLELAPDARLRFDHLEMAGAGVLVLATWAGTREGGRFEDLRAAVWELDEEGRVRRVDNYDRAQLAEARARFSSLTASCEPSGATGAG